MDLMQRAPTEPGDDARSVTKAACKERCERRRPPGNANTEASGPESRAEFDLAVVEADDGRPWPMLVCSALRIGERALPQRRARRDRAHARPKRLEATFAETRPQLGEDVDKGRFRFDVGHRQDAVGCEVLPGAHPDTAMQVDEAVDSNIGEEEVAGLCPISRRRDRLHVASSHGTIDEESRDEDGEIPSRRRSEPLADARCALEHGDVEALRARAGLRRDGTQGRIEGLDKALRPAGLRSHVRVSYEDAQRRLGPCLRLRQSAPKSEEHGNDVAGRLLGPPLATHSRPRNPRRTLKTCILGGGITGLAVARLLDPARFDVRVLERDPILGGLCRSSVIDGFTCDHAGGHIIFSKNKRVLAWMIEHVGRAPDAPNAQDTPNNVVEQDRNTRIRWHDRYVPYPFENGVGHLTPEAKFDCLKGYLEAVERRKGGEPCPENFHDWILWKMGSGFAEHFMFPYNRKLWECDLRDMASAWVAGRVPDAPIDDILKAAVGWTTEGYVHQAKFWFPLEGGFQALTDGVARACPHEILTSTPCESLRRDGDGWLVNGERYDFVVNTMPLQELVKVFEDLPGDVRADIDALVPISLVNVLVAMKVDQQLDPLSWVYLPFEDQGPANRITFYSNYSPRNAPLGHASYMAEITYRGRYDFDEAKKAELLQGLEHAGMLRRSDVVLTHHWNNRYAYIDQDHAFAARIARVRSWFDASGMLTLGRFGRYEYHNSDQCIERAFQAVEQIEACAASGDRMRFAFDA